MEKVKFREQVLAELKNNVCALVELLLAFVPCVGVAREVGAVAPHQERAQLLGGSVGHRRAPRSCKSRREMTPSVFSIRHQVSAEGAIPLLRTVYTRLMNMGTWLALRVETRQVVHPFQIGRH